MLKHASSRAASSRMRRACCTNLQRQAFVRGCVPLQARVRRLRQCTNSTSMSSTSMSSTSMSTTSTSKPSAAASFISQFNSTIAHRPLTMFWVFMGLRFSTFFMMYRGFMVFDIFNYPELAVGYLCARVTSKFRQPLNVLGAAGLSAAFPVLSELRMSVLMTGMGQGAGLQQDLTADIIASKSLSLKQKQTRIKYLDKFFEYLTLAQKPIDKYGLSFYLSAKLSSLMTVGGSAYAISQGFDINEMLQSWGMSTDLQDGFGAMAGAAFCNAPLLPMHMVATVHATNKLATIMDAQEATMEVEDLEEVASLQGQGYSHSHF